MQNKLVVLCILDGWGLTDDDRYSAIAQASTPFYDSLLKNYPHTQLEASGLAVGLPEGQMGNSEVGHSTIGAGRVIFQDLPKIDRLVASGEIENNPILLDAIGELKKNHKALHLMSLLSDGGVHSHMDHMVAIAKIAAKNGVKVWLHCFLDGRDTPQKSAITYLERLQKNIENQPIIAIATLCGRYYAMDRDKNWDRIARTYNILINKANEDAPLDPLQAVEASYDRAITDEFFEPLALPNYPGMVDGDAFICCNFRADRARESTQALGDVNFNAFSRDRVIDFSTKIQFTEYSVEHSKYLRTMFPAEKISESLGEIVAANDLKQLRIAETEKYAHVTFFFNGGLEKEFEGEDRILVKSPAVVTYDLQPEMSCPEVNQKLRDALEAGKYQFVVVNFANPDMVGHTGNMEAAVRAVETIDGELEKLVATVKSLGGTIFVTADHGNVEKMFDEVKNQPHTAHTTNLVPFIVIRGDGRGDISNNADNRSDNKTNMNDDQNKNNNKDIGDKYKEQEHNKSFKPLKLSSKGTLADIAPTVLKELNLPIPESMTGKSLIED